MFGLIFLSFVLVGSFGVVSGGYFSDEKINSLKSISVEPLWSVMLQKSDGTQINMSILRIEELSYDDKVYILNYFYSSESPYETTISTSESMAFAINSTNTCDSLTEYDRCMEDCADLNDENINCRTQCDQQYSCQFQQICLSYAPDNSCGVNKITREIIKTDGNLSFELNFNPETGTLSTIFFNGEQLSLIKENGFMSVGRIPRAFVPD